MVIRAQLGSEHIGTSHLNNYYSWAWLSIVIWAFIFRLSSLLEHLFTSEILLTFFFPLIIFIWAIFSNWAFYLRKNKIDVSIIFSSVKKKSYWILSSLGTECLSFSSNNFFLCWAFLSEYFFGNKHFNMSIFLNTYKSEHTFTFEHFLRAYLYI